MIAINLSYESARETLVELAAILGHRFLEPNLKFDNMYVTTPNDEPILKVFEDKRPLSAFAADFWIGNKYQIYLKWEDKTRNVIIIYDNYSSDQVVFSRTITEFAPKALTVNGNDILVDVLNYFSAALEGALIKLFPPIKTINSVEEALNDFDSIDFEDL